MRGPGNANSSLPQIADAYEGRLTRLMVGRVGRNLLHAGAVLTRGTKIGPTSFQQSAGGPVVDQICSYVFQSLP